jgi:flavin reductase (DIM6/NTAB) family NADH-FMN oxidoreductase RutF
VAADWRREFQAIVASLDYPMYIVTTAGGGERAGCLVGFATQSSIHPPKFVVGISRQNHTFGVACRASALAVHCPSRDQHALAELFGAETGDEIDKFARCRWRGGPEGLPILEECETWFAGRIAERVDIGDHVGFLLEVIAARHGRRGPQLSFQDVRDVEAGHAP